MKQKTNSLSLTAAHIAAVHRVIEDTGLPSGVVQQTDADYADWVQRIAQSRPLASSSIQLFAYGSLIWKPEIDHVSEQLATARGWHRSFCLRMHRFRGTVEQPGLMMALDRGGQCQGVLYELPRANIEVQLDQLFRREFTLKPINSAPRWIRVATSSGTIDALSFVMNRASPYYAGRLALDQVATILAKACGHWGSGAEYLFNTVTHLEKKGIRDGSLWRLQQLVAREIETLQLMR